MYHVHVHAFDLTFFSPCNFCLVTEYFLVHSSIFSLIHDISSVCTMCIHSNWPINFNYHLLQCHALSMEATMLLCMHVHAFDLTSDLSSLHAIFVS